MREKGEIFGSWIIEGRENFIKCMQVRIIVKCFMLVMKNKVCNVSIANLGTL